MDLTAWQRICNRLLGPFVKKRARRDKELSANLVKGSMGMMPEVYLSTVIVTSIAITLMSWAFVAIFFIPLFFVLVRRTTRDTLKKLHIGEPKPGEGAA